MSTSGLSPSTSSQRTSSGRASRSGPRPRSPCRLGDERRRVALEAQRVPGGRARVAWRDDRAGRVERRGGERRDDVRLGPAAGRRARRSRHPGPRPRPSPRPSRPGGSSTGPAPGPGSSIGRAARHSIAAVSGAAVTTTGILDARPPRARRGRAAGPAGRRVGPRAWRHRTGCRPRPRARSRRPAVDLDPRRQPSPRPATVG